MRYFYSAVLLVALPLIVVRMIWRSRRAPAYRSRLKERLGKFDPPPPRSGKSIWVHAVSLGETLAARPLVERILAANPNDQVVMTTTTPTGSEQVRKLFEGRVFHVYAPWDTPFAVKNFLDRVRPDLLILMETELWPNMLHYTRMRGARIMLANARLSARSAAGYARFARTTRDMFAALDRVAVQNGTDADRFLQLGMDPSRLSVPGSIKFDISLDDTERSAATALRQSWKNSDRPTVIAASTHEGEDEVVLGAFRKLRESYGDALLLLAPRHPERFDRVAALCEREGWNTLRRSRADLPDGSTDILMLDTLGELLLLYGTADVAVIGGSFIDHGGHNPLEAAVWGIPQLCGDSMTNFRDIANKLSEVGALESLSDGNALAQSLLMLFNNDAEMQRRGDAARAIVEANRGALDALSESVQRLLGPH
ncbi:MAG: lipid IV(A) 3-deoxy-D-manno-octulosonic acid transferase [Pseudomonadota bacterium]